MTTPTSNWEPLFETLCASRKMVSLVVTGGGAGAIIAVLSTHGCIEEFC